MTEDQFNSARELFTRALDYNPDDRERFLVAECLDDVVRARVRSLLEADERLGRCALNPLLDSTLARSQVDVVEESSGQHAGQILKGKYLLGDELPSGMSVVYVASDLALPGKRWVIKILKQGALNPHWLQDRFRAEKRTLTALEHPGIVAIFDAGELNDNSPYFVMPFVDGVTLRSEIDDGPLDAARVLQVVHEAAEALTYAHRKGVWHLDVKPSNIMLRDPGAVDERVCLIDFGIAMLQKHDADGGGSYLPAGTRGYMAPEQAAGRPCHASDVYSLGVVTFEMLTGRLPDARDLADLQAGRPRDPRKARQGASGEDGHGVVALPETAKRVLGRALDPDPARRQESPRAFAAELKRSLSTVTGWQRAIRSAVDHFRALPRLGRAALLATLTMAVVFIAARAYLGDRARDDPPATPTAVASGEPLDSVGGLLQNYRSTHDQFRRNVQLQVIFVLMGALIVWRAGSRLKIPLFGVTLSTTWACFALPLILVVLWLDFGFMLDDLINWRAEAWSQMVAANSTERADGFNDSGFIDGWFMAFRPGEHTIKTDFRLGTIFMFCLTYGSLLAANHALSIMLVWFGNRWSRHDVTNQPAIDRIAVAAFPWLVAALILLSHVQFRLGGSNPNWLQEFVAGLVFVFSAAAWWHVSERRELAGDGDAAAPLTIAAVGDSLTTGFCVSSRPGMIWRARRHRQCSWFADRSGAIKSLAARLSATHRVKVHQFATVAAKVTDEGGRTMQDRLLGTRHFSEQVSRVCALRRFPDVILLWIGHNSLDWAEGQPTSSTPNAGRLFAALTDVFIASYEYQVRKLIDAAGRAPKPVVIVIFGLADFGQFFAARESAEQIRAAGSRLYPRLEDGLRFFTSMRPAHRQGMVVLARAMNVALERMVATVVDQATMPSHVTVRYSNALYDTDISSAAALSEVDGWHPSRLGHALLAASAHEFVEELLSLDRSSSLIAVSDNGIPGAWNRTGV